MDLTVWLWVTDLVSLSPHICKTMTMSLFYLASGSFKQIKCHISNICNIYISLRTAISRHYVFNRFKYFFFTTITHNLQISLLSIWILLNFQTPSANFSFHRFCSVSVVFSWHFPNYSISALCAPLCSPSRWCGPWGIDLCPVRDLLCRVGRET